jgi:hypothetical protein
MSYKPCLPRLPCPVAPGDGTGAESNSLFKPAATCDSCYSITPKPHLLEHCCSTGAKWSLSPALLLPLASSPAPFASLLKSQCNGTLLERKLVKNHVE